MAPSKLIALFIAFVAVAATLQLSEARVQGFKAVAVDQEASELAIAANDEASEPSSKAAAGGGGGFPGFPPLPGMPQIPGFPLPLPQTPGFPSFPPLFGFPFPPLPQIPGFPRFPPLFGPLPGAPGAPPSQALPGFPHLPPFAGFPGLPSAPPSQALPGLPTSPPTGFPSLPGSPPSPPQRAECQTPLMGLSTCMDYLTNITVLSPPSTCCDGLKSVINNAPICLCHGMNGGMSNIFPKPIDPIRMLILPARCGTMLPIETIFMCFFTQPVPPLTPPSSPAPSVTPLTPPSSPAPLVPPVTLPSSPAPASSPMSPPSEVSP